MEQLDVRAAVAFTVPSKEGSWQAGQGLNELEITGFAVLTYPCRSMVDPIDGEIRAMALIYGEVSAKMVGLSTRDDTTHQGVPHVLASPDITGIVGEEKPYVVEHSGYIASVSD